MSTTTSNIRIKQIVPRKFRRLRTGDAYWRARIRIAYQFARYLRRKLADADRAVSYGYIVAKRYQRLVKSCRK